jgi:glucose-1-phosphate cytidylyltransferase
MKVVILAGGKGSRLSEYTKKIPKPMVKIKDIPIIVHIMKIYAGFGYKEFIIAAGFKSKIIKNFFKKKILDWKVDVVDTGLHSMTGGRIRRLKTLLKNKKFFLTYGDGVSNININKLLKFHIKCKSTVTLTAVRPPARFGAITIKGKKVTIFREKSILDQGWINGGFFVVEPSIFKYLKNDKTVLENYPLTKLGKERKLYAYKHNGFWYCMDTLRDKEILEKKLKSIL